MSMPNVTLAYAALLILVGLIAYASTGATTALIPAFFGLPFALLGGLAMKESLRKHAMHAAAALALVVVCGLVPLVLKGYNPDRPLAFPTQLVALLGTVGYLAMSIRSFVAARRARMAGVASS